MFNRSGLFLLIIIAAVGVPYFMSAEQAGTRARIAHVWDKMFSDTISDRYPRTRRPDSTASPVPGYSGSSDRSRLQNPPWEYRPQDRVAQFSVEQPPSRGFTSGGAMPTWTRAPNGGMTPASITPQAMGSQTVFSGTYPENPLEGMAAQQGATEWRAVTPGEAGSLSGAVVPQSGGMTALPIPHAATQPMGVPDEEGWVTVGPAAGYGVVSTGAATIADGTTAGFPGVPPGAQILPGIVVGGPGAPGAAGHQRAAFQNIEELLSFQHAPGWVVDSWPRVSTHIIQGDLSGMRVPLVSGTDATALAGSLSYYFDRSQKLQRIAFEGATGDPTRLINVLTDEHRLQAEPSLGGGMFVAYDPAASTAVQDIANVLRLRRTPVVRSSQPLQKYLVMLELNRPESGRKISEEMSRLLQLDQRSRRWTSPPVSGDGRVAPQPNAPLDPRDPFSPANPNDAFLPAQQAVAPTQPQPSASPLPRGAVPSDGRFQNSLQRPPAATARPVVPVPQPVAPVLPPPLTQSPPGVVPPST